MSFEDPSLENFASYMHGSQFFTATSGALLFLSILGGAGPSAPLSFTYYLEVDTSGIEGALDRTRWNFFKVCGVDGGGNNANCQGVRLAPLAAWDPDANGLPSGLQGPMDGNRIRADIYGVWLGAWILTWFWIIFTLAKLADSIHYNKFSAMHIEAGRVVRYTPFFAGLVVCVLTLYAFISVQVEFGRGGREATIGAAGVGFLVGSFVAISFSELLLLRIRRKLKYQYEALQS